MHFAITIIFVLSAFIFSHYNIADAFSSGAPSTACDTLQPIHGSNSPVECLTGCPFSIGITEIGGEAVAGTAESLLYRCGQTHTSNKVDLVAKYDMTY